MTTNGSQTAQCPHCAEAEAARDAAEAEAAARQEAIDHLHDILAPDRNGDYVALAASLCEEAHKIVLAVRDPSPAIAALERRLAEVECENCDLLNDISSQLTAAGITDGEVSSTGTWPLSEPARVRIALQELERLRALAVLVPSAEDTRALAERYEYSAQVGYALAARIEAARGQGQEDGGDE